MLAKTGNEGQAAEVADRIFLVIDGLRSKHTKTSKY